MLICFQQLSANFVFPVSSRILSFWLKEWTQRRRINEMGKKSNNNPNTISIHNTVPKPSSKTMGSQAFASYLFFLSASLVFVYTYVLYFGILNWLDYFAHNFCSFMAHIKFYRRIDSMTWTHWRKHHDGMTSMSGRSGRDEENIKFQYWSFWSHERWNEYVFFSIKFRASIRINIVWAKLQCSDGIQLYFAWTLAFFNITNMKFAPH